MRGGSPKKAVRAGRKAWTRSDSEAGNNEANRPTACREDGIVRQKREEVGSENV